MKITFTDEFKDKVAAFIVGTLILTVLLLPFTIAGGIEAGFLF